MILPNFGGRLGISDHVLPAFLVLAMQKVRLSPASGRCMHPAAPQSA
jgi:hypothetical protein